MATIGLMPNINMPRYRKNIPFRHNTSFNHGQLIPIDCIPVVAGTTLSVDLASLIRMSTPIAPIMDNITAYVYSFFVPMRLVWQHTAEFFGANLGETGQTQTNYTIPTRNIFGDGVNYNSLSRYLGKPISSISGSNVQASVLKERGYWLIVENYFRAQQIETPFIIRTWDQGDIAKQGNTVISFSANPYQVNKKLDYFTTATLSPVLGGDVLLPLGVSAPVYSTGALKLAGSGSNGLNLTASGSQYDSGAKTLIGIDNPGQGVSPSGNLSYESGLAVDLSSATAATINSLYYAMAVNKYLAKSQFGNRFFEQMQIHYGVTNPDLTLQIPERLGGMKFNINVDQVLSTAGYANDSSSNVGQPGAVSVTAHKGALFTKSFGEPGYVYILIETKQDQSYAQGLMKEDTKTNRFEFFTPELANLGEDAILNKEIYVEASNPDEVFGYQEHWSEYRTRFNRTSGLLNPNVPNALDYWTLTNKFSSQPMLDTSFIKESRDNISRALVTGSTGPDYIADFYVMYKTTSLVPLNSFGGLPFNGRY